MGECPTFYNQCIGLTCPCHSLVVYAGAARSPVKRGPGFNPYVGPLVTMIGHLHPVVLSDGQVMTYWQVLNSSDVILAGVGQSGDDILAGAGQWPGDQVAWGGSLQGGGGRGEAGGLVVTGSMIGRDRRRTEMKHQEMTRWQSISTNVTIYVIRERNYVLITCLSLMVQCRFELEEGWAPRSSVWGS